MKALSSVMIGLLIVSCATAPQPRSQQDPAEVFGPLYQLASDPVVCWASQAAHPKLRPYAAAERERRAMPCPEAVIFAGGEMVRRYEDSVRAAKTAAQARAEAEARQAQADRERTDAIKAVAGRAFDFLLVLGGAYAMGQALAPRPAKPVICQTHYGQAHASTTCW